MTQRSRSRNAVSLQDLKEQVALANRLMHHYGLTTCLGAVSARIPGTNHVLCKAQPHIAMSQVRAEDIMTFDLDGNVLEHSGDYPTIFGEWPLFTEIYKVRPDVTCALHTHQKWCTILGIAGKPVLPVHHPSMASVAAEPWPIYVESYATVKTEEQGRLVAGLLRNNVACHLRTHGMVFVGATVERAVTAAINAEHQAEMTWQALLAGTPATIPMRLMRGSVERRFLPENQEEPRDGVERGTWENYAWLDQHREASRYRVVQL